MADGPDARRAVTPGETSEPHRHWWIPWYTGRRLCLRCGDNKPLAVSPRSDA